MWSFVRQFQRQIWPTFWYFLLLPAKCLRQGLLWLVRPAIATPDEEVEHCCADREHPSGAGQHDASYAPNSPGRIIVEERHATIERSDDKKLLMIGIFAEVYLLKNTVVRKVARSQSDEDMQPVLREATVYSLLGEHPRIAECLPRGTAGFVDVKYYPHGDLATFMLNKKDEVTLGLQRKWFQQIIEAVVKIYEHGVIHSDLALRQFFLDDSLDARLGDFNSSQYAGHIALGYEKASHCLPRDYEAPNSVTSDLFALGSTLCELLAGKAPYNELYHTEPQSALHSADRAAVIARAQRKQQADLEIEARYRKQEFPDVSFWGGDIILGCWKGTVTSAREALRQYMALTMVL